MSSKQNIDPDRSPGQTLTISSRLASGNLLPIAILIIISTAIYYNSLSNGFVFDDYAVIVENKHIDTLTKNLPAFFSKSYFTVANGEASYRPVATLSYFLIHSLAGKNPFYYHLSSVALHALNSVLVYLLFSLLTGGRFKAVLAAILFACHPALAEAVNCIAFNEDLLTAFFFLLALILYIKNADNVAAGAGYFLSLVFFLCGLLAKEMAITLLPIIVLRDLTFGGSQGLPLSVPYVLSTLKERWRFYLGYVAVSMFYLVLRFLLFTHPGDGVKPQTASLLERLLYLPNHLFSFVKLAIAPHDLNVDHMFSYPGSFIEISNLIGFLFIVGLVVFSFFLFKRSKTIFFGIWWFIITLLPVYNIIQIFNPLAERFLYIPAIGFCLLVPVIVGGIARRLTAREAVVTTAVLFVVLAMAGVYANTTIARNRDWQDSFTLWSKTVSQAPDSGVAHGSLGRAYQEQGRLPEAIAAYEAAVSLMPHHYKAYYNLGVVYAEIGRIDNAVDNYKKSILINADFANAHFNLANIYHKRGLTDDAIRHYTRVIELVPEDLEARNNLGVALAMQGKLEQAISTWQKILQIDPDNISVRDNVRKARKIMEKSNLNDD